MNVGLTRAKHSLFILGHSASLMKNDYWGKLINDAMERKLHVDVSYMTLFSFSVLCYPIGYVFLYVVN